MDVLSGFLFVLRAVFGSLFSAAVLAPIVYILRAVLPKPRNLSYQFLAGFAYLLLFIFLAHLAYFLSYYSCPTLPDLPDWEQQCVPPGLMDIVSPALRASLVLAPYFFLFFSAAFFVYKRAGLSSIFLRIYLATLVFLVVMLLWVVVFPWSLERYLRLFY